MKLFRGTCQEIEGMFCMPNLTKSDSTLIKFGLYICKYDISSVLHCINNFSNNWNFSRVIQAFAAMATNVAIVAIGL